VNVADAASAPAGHLGDRVDRLGTPQGWARAGLGGLVDRLITGDELIGEPDS
jgi:hypothetical protein